MPFIICTIPIFLNKNPSGPESNVIWQTFTSSHGWRVNRIWQYIGYDSIRYTALSTPEVNKQSTNWELWNILKRRRRNRDTTDWRAGCANILLVLQSSWGNMTRYFIFSLLSTLYKQGLIGFLHDVQPYDRATFAQFNHISVQNETIIG